jgi:chromosome segregation ATPase
MPDIENRLQSIENKLDQKADKADIDRLDKRIDALESKLDHKADKADIERLYAELDKKADKADIEKLYAELDKKADKADIEKLYTELDKKADKTDLLPLATEISALRADVTTLQNQMSQVIALLEKQSQTLDIIRTEQKAISATLSLHEERIGRLEDKVFGHRVREQDEKYGKKRD